MQNKETTGNTTAPGDAGGPGKQISKSNNWFENSLKVIPTLIAVGGFIFGIFTFQAQQRTTQTQSFKMKLWEKKLAVYEELANVSGDIIIHRDDTSVLDSLTDHFDKIYYSSLILVQDDSVETMVRLYKDALSDYRKGIKSILFLKDKQIALMRNIGESLKKNQDFGK